METRPPCSECGKELTLCQCPPLAGQRDEPLPEERELSDLPPDEIRNLVFASSPSGDISIHDLPLDNLPIAGVSIEKLPIDALPIDDILLWEDAIFSKLSEDFDNRYRIVGQIGRGGMGTILRAEHVGLGKEVAIKVLKSELMFDKVALARFEKEARACAALSHVNLVTVFDYGITAIGQPYLVMEFVPGASLIEFLNSSESFSTDQLIDVLLQICNGLSYAHDNGVVHRDLKPGNIILSFNLQASETVKIVDFGVAKIEDMGGGFQMLTSTGEVFGSPNYMSPEQCRGKVVDNRTDIYAFGCILYEILTGKQLFRAESILAVLDKQMKEAPPAIVLSKRWKDAPLELSKIVMKCLEKDPDNRYQHISEIAQELQAVHNRIAPKKRERLTLASRVRLGLVAFTVSLVIVFLVSVGFVAGYLMGRDDGVIAASLACYKDRIGLKDQSLDQFNTLFAWNTNSTDASAIITLILMDFLNENGQFDQVIQLYRKRVVQEALSTVRENPPSNRQLISIRGIDITAPMICYTTALAYDKKSDFGKAREVLVDGLKLSESLESPPWVRFKLSKMYGESLLVHDPKQPAKALGYLSQSLELICTEDPSVLSRALPEIEESYRLLAIALDTVGKKNDAIQCRQALEQLKLQLGRATTPR